MPEKRLHVNLERLPADEAARRIVLRDYFHEKEATAALNGDGWDLSLQWSNDWNRYVDPQLNAGLAWWRASTVPSDMALAVRSRRRIYEALYDSWTLHAWSNWLASKTGAVAPVILHVDDHRDLDVPRIFFDRHGYRDAITGAPFHIGDPDSVAAAIVSGAIGMGSFMTPFLHFCPNAEVRQLCQPPKVSSTSDFVIERGTEPDALLEPDAERPSIKLTAADGQVGPGRYRIAADISAWLGDLSPGPALLHIDMDYFCNRYDGDSDWADREHRLDPSLESILGRIDEVVAGLAAGGVGGQIESTTVVYSPGFFPAEFWQPAGEHLINGLEQLYGR